MPLKKKYFFIKILSVIGVLLSVYLLWQQIFQPAFRPCSISASINCDAVISGPVAKTFGISTPLYGLVGYIIILLAVFLNKKKLLLAMSTFGFLFCLSLAYIEIVQLKVICPVCIGCQIIMATIFILALNIYKTSNSQHTTTKQTA